MGDNSTSLIDMYQFLDLEYGSSIDTIRNKIRDHYKDGKITQQLNVYYSEIIDIISIPDNKDQYDRSYLKHKINDDLIVNLVWRLQRHGFKDYYRMLNVDITASTKEIRVKQIKLAKQYHPDKSCGDTKKFEMLNDAMRILSMEQSRMLYNSIYRNFYKDMNFLENNQIQEGQPLQRNKIQKEQRQVFIKNFNGNIKTLKEEIKHYGRVENLTKLGQKMVLVTMKSTEGAKQTIEYINGRRIGKYIIRAGPYKTIEQLERERAERREEETRRREERYQNYDTSEVEVVWQSGQS